MLNLKSRLRGFCLLTAAVLALAGCTQPAFNFQTVDQPLRTTVVDPIDAQSLGLRNLASFDLYVDKEAVHAAFVANPNDGKQPYIGYLHSEDGGLHWSAPQALSRQFSQVVESKFGNDIQIAAARDRLLIVWQTRGELPGMGPLSAVYSNDAGNSWQPGANPAGMEGDQSHHELAADAEGRFHAVWLDDRDENGYQGLRYARSSDGGRHWELAQTIDDSSCSCCWNRLSIGGDGRINVLYRDMEFRDMALAQSADAGMTWRRLSTVGVFNWKFDGCPHNGGGLTQTGDGSLHAVVWTGAENSAGLYHIRSGDGGQTWVAPQRAGVGTAGFHADIAAGPGRLAMVWDAMGPEGSQVYFSESGDNGGSWSAARLLSSPGASAEFPRIAATPEGFLAMWSEKQSGGGKRWLSAVLQ